MIDEIVEAMYEHIRARMVTTYPSQDDIRSAVQAALQREFIAAWRWRATDGDWCYATRREWVPAGVAAEPLYLKLPRFINRDEADAFMALTGWRPV